METYWTVKYREEYELDNGTTKWRTMTDLVRAISATDAEARFLKAAEKYGNTVEVDGANRSKISRVIED